MAVNCQQLPGTNRSEPMAFLARSYSRILNAIPIRVDGPWAAAPALVYLVVTFGIPVGFIVSYSFHSFVYGQQLPGWTGANYLRVASDATYRDSLLRSVGFVAAVSFGTVLTAAPFAYWVAVHVSPHRRKLLLGLAALPFLASFLARVVAWLTILGDQGVLNVLLQSAGLTSGPLSFLALGRTAIVITFINLLAPLAFFTIYAALERVDTGLFEAANDLGARSYRVFVRIVIPLSASGMVSAFALVFISMFGDYITPVLIGGTDGILFVNLLVNQFGQALQWGFGAAMAVIMVVATAVLLSFLRRMVPRGSSGEITRRLVKPPPVWLSLYGVLFLLFLYAPIALLLLLALNSSATVGLPIAGLTLKWFSEILSDPSFQDALLKSLIVGLSAATLGTIMGALAALAVSRARGWARNAALGFITVPIFMPPVVLGIGIVLAMHAAGINRGLWSLIGGHTLLSLPVAFLVILARLEGLAANQELAAMDLGASPIRALIRVTIPQTSSALAAAFLLALAFSLDEFIMTFLITGTDTTLPLYVYSVIKFQMNPGIMAGASVILLMSALILAVGLLVHSSERLNRYRVETGANQR